MRLCGVDLVACSLFIFFSRGQNGKHTSFQLGWNLIDDNFACCLDVRREMQVVTSSLQLVVREGFEICCQTPQCTYRTVIGSMKY